MGWNLTQALTQTQTQTQMDVVDQGVQYIAESSMLLFVLVCPCLSIRSHHHNNNQHSHLVRHQKKRKAPTRQTKNKTSDKQKLNIAPTKSKKPSSPQVCRILPGPGGSSTTKPYPANSSVSLNSSAAFALAEDREGLLITQSLTF